MQRNSVAQNNHKSKREGSAVVGNCSSDAGNDYLKVQEKYNRLSLNVTQANNHNNQLRRAHPAVEVLVVNDDGEVPCSRTTTPTQNWQASKNEVKERIEFMFNNETLADVHFVVGKGSNVQRIPAHKFMLAIGSSVFDAMFNGGLATDSDEIEIPDVEPSALFALLRFLYTDKVQIGPETVMTTLYAAKKYAVPALEMHCVKFLQNNLTYDNAFMLLTQARLFDEPELATMCLKTIDKNTTDALAADGFTDIDLDTLCSVLSRDTLRIKEAKLFQAVIRWSAAECERQGLPVTTDNQRNVLGRALKLIRFPLMTVDEFAGCAAQSGLLLDKEVVSLFLYFIVNPKPAIDFIDTPRSTMPAHELLVNRFQQVEMRWGYSGPSDRIRFIVDHPIFVLGFGLYGSVYLPSEYSVFIELIHTPTNKVLGSNDTTFSSDGSTSVFRVMFEEPIQVLANNSYTASATIKGLDTHYGTKGLRKVHVESPLGRITFQFSYSPNNNNGTSVEDGQIPQILFYT